MHHTAPAKGNVPIPHAARAAGKRQQRLRSRNERDKKADCPGDHLATAVLALVGMKVVLGEEGGRVIGVIREPQGSCVPCCDSHMKADVLRTPLGRVTFGWGRRALLALGNALDSALLPDLTSQRRPCLPVHLAVHDLSKDVPRTPFVPPRPHLVGIVSPVRSFDPRFLRQNRAQECSF